MGRLAALARTQALLTRAADASVDLEELIRDELMAHAADGGQFSLVGPKVALAPKAGEVLTLAIHELATNAIKHGALSGATGRVKVTWSRHNKDGQSWLRLVWEEAGLTGVGHSRRAGFGTQLITRRIPYELEGTSSLEIKPDGALCVMDFPLRNGESILQTHVPAGADIMPENAG